MQLAKVTQLNANNPIPVYGVETKEKKKAAPKAKVVKMNTGTPKQETDLWYQIAMCAYYKAETRGFASGFEMEDWLAAEAEIKNEHR